MIQYNMRYFLDSKVMGRHHSNRRPKGRCTCLHRISHRLEEELICCRVEDEVTSVERQEEVSRWGREAIHPKGPDLVEVGQWCYSKAEGVVHPCQRVEVFKEHYAK